MKDTGFRIGRACIFALGLSALGSGAAQIDSQSAPRPAPLTTSFDRSAAASPAEATIVQPVHLSFAPEESVYGPPQPPTELEMVNEGGVNVDLTVRYMTDNVFRGIDRSEVGGAEDAPNLQFDGRIYFDLGNKKPHPFVGTFVNVYNSDPISRFQEIRPFFGADFTLRPLIFEAGYTTYIFPERDDDNTSEFYAKITIMDEALFRTEKPILRPYLLAVYDFDVYNGWYYEAGIEHIFEIEKTGLSIKLSGLVSYSNGIELFRGDGPKGSDNGFQRYEIGVMGRYSLNTLLNFSRRWGEWSLVGYGYYADNLDDNLKVDSQIWSGGGIEFRY